MRHYPGEPTNEAHTPALRRPRDNRLPTSGGHNAGSGRVGRIVSIRAEQAHPDRCPSHVYYSTWGAHDNYRDMVSPAWGPGITLSIALARGHTVTTTVGGSRSFSASAIVASAKATISASISYAVTSSVTYTGSGTIPSTWSRGGYLHAGAHRYSCYRNEYESTPQCTDVVLGHGTTTSPSHIPSFWKTRA